MRKLELPKAHATRYVSVEDEQMIVRLEQGKHFKDWVFPEFVQRNTPRLLVQGFSLVPSLNDDVCDWLNDNVFHPFYLVGVGELSKSDDGSLALVGMGEIVEDDHIRFTDAKDFTLFKMFWE